LFYYTNIKAMKTLIGSKSRLLSGVAFLFAIFSISVSCTKTIDDGNGPGDPGSLKKMNEVSIQGFTFSPAVITVPGGTLVTWTNKGSDIQSVVSDDGLFNSIISINESYSYKFSTTGTYQYHSRIHPDMTGKVVVN
jgi:plastocyanin